MTTLCALARRITEQLVNPSRLAATSFRLRECPQSRSRQAHLPAHSSVVCTSDGVKCKLREPGAPGRNWANWPCRAGPARIRIVMALPVAAPSVVLCRALPAPGFPTERSERRGCRARPGQLQHRHTGGCEERSKVVIGKERLGAGRTERGCAAASGRLSLALVRTIGRREALSGIKTQRAGITAGGRKRSAAGDPGSHGGLGFGGPPTRDLEQRDSRCWHRLMKSRASHPLAGADVVGSWLRCSRQQRSVGPKKPNVLLAGNLLLSVDDFAEIGSGRMTGAGACRGHGIAADLRECESRVIGEKNADRAGANGEQRESSAACGSAGENGSTGRGG